jgi:ribosomal protein S7
VLFTDEHVQKASGVKLDNEAVVVLNKLVGCLTKEGKRSKANRILLDSLHIIRQSAGKNAT